MNLCTLTEYTLVLIFALIMSMSVVPSGKSRMPSYSSPPATPHTSTISPQSGHDSEGDSGHPSSPDEFLSVSKTTPTPPPPTHTQKHHATTLEKHKILTDFLIRMQSLFTPSASLLPPYHHTCTYTYMYTHTHAQQSRMPVVKLVLLVCSPQSSMRAWTPRCPC